MTDNDLDWLVSLCKRRYSNHYDPITTEAWFRNMVLKNPQLYLAQRTDNAFCITHIYVLPWTGTEIEVDVMFLCAEHGAGWETLELLRASIAWARTHNGKRWRLSSDTEFDLTPLARRVGARLLTPRCVLDL
jgi:hypothetical protein